MMLELPSSDDGEMPTGVVVVAKRSKGKGKEKKDNKVKKDNKEKALKKYRRHEGTGLKEYVQAKVSIMPPIEWPCKPIHMSGPADHYWEMFCPPRVSPLMPQKNTRSFDEINGWTIAPGKAADQIKQMHMVFKPAVVLLCPPCTHVGSLMFSNWYRMLQHRRECEVDYSLWQIQFSAALANQQCLEGRWYIFAHPDRALTWDLPFIIDLPGEKVRFDQCQVGLKGPSGLPLMKRTIIKTNIPGLIRRLESKVCRGGNQCQRHGNMSGRVNSWEPSKWAHVYPPGLCAIFQESILELC